MVIERDEFEIGSDIEPYWLGEHVEDCQAKQRHEQQTDGREEDGDAGMAENAEEIRRGADMT